MSIKCIRTALLVLALFSIYGVLVRMGLVPSFFCNCERYARIGETLTSLALSIAAALIIYAITVALPEYLNRIKAYKGLRPSFEEVYSDLSYLIGALMMMAGISKPEKEVKEEDWIDFSKSHFIFQEQWYVHRYTFHDEFEVHNLIRGFVDTEKDLHKKIQSIKNKIDNINRSPLVRGLSLDTIDLLRNIHQSPALFVIEYTLTSRAIIQETMGDKKTEYQLLSDFSSKMRELSQFHFELRRLCQKPIDYKFVPMTDEEIIKYKQERDALLPSLSNALIMRQIKEVDEAIMNGIRIL